MDREDSSRDGHPGAAVQQLADGAGIHEEILPHAVIQAELQRCARFEAGDAILLTSYEVVENKLVAALDLRAPLFSPPARTPKMHATTETGCGLQSVSPDN